MPTFFQDPLTGLWRFWASRKLTLALLALLAAIVLLMLVFPQMPVGIQSDPSAYGRWFADMRSRYGGYQEALQRLGLFHLGASLGLRLLLAAMALNAAVHIAEGASAVARLARGGGQQGVASLQGLALSGAALPAAWLDWASGRRMRAITDANGLPIEARRFPWRGAYLLLPYVALLLLLLGLAINDRAGWQVNGLILSAGQEAAVGQESGLALQGIEASQGASPSFTLLRDGQAAKAGRFVDGLPWRFRSYLLWRTAEGPAVQVRAQNRAGEAIALRSQPARPVQGQGTELVFRDTGDEGYLLVSGLPVSFRLTYYADIPQAPQRGPVIHVEAIRSGETLPTWDTWLEGDSSWTYQGITFQAAQQRYALVNVAFMPGLALIALGILALLVGIILVLTSSPLYGLCLQNDDSGCHASLYYVLPLLGALDRRRIESAKETLRGLPTG